MIQVADVYNIAVDSISSRLFWVNIFDLYCLKMILYCYIFSRLNKKPEILKRNQMNFYMTDPVVH